MAKARKGYPLAKIKGPTRTRNINDRRKIKKPAVIIDENGVYPDIPVKRSAYYSEH
jgi:hypothetical protein